MGWVGGKGTEGVEGIENGGKRCSNGKGREGKGKEMGQEGRSGK